MLSYAYTHTYILTHTCIHTRTNTAAKLEKASAKWKQEKEQIASKQKRLDEAAVDLKDIISKVQLLLGRATVRKRTQIQPIIRLQDCDRVIDSIRQVVVYLSTRGL